MVHNLLSHFFTLGSSKVKGSEPFFLIDIVTMHNDHPSYLKHVLGGICVFFKPIWVLGAGGGVLPRGGWVHNLPLRVFTSGSSKIEVSETYFSDIVTTHNDHPSYIRHALGSFHVVSPLQQRGNQMQSYLRTCCVQRGVELMARTLRAFLLKARPLGPRKSGTTARVGP